MTSVAKIRALIVDDAVVVRKVLSDVLNADPDIEVVGTAANGRLGLQKLPQVKPDIVVLDIEMPEMDGLATLKEIRKIDRRLPVIMFSTLTERGARATLDALSFGASDYVTKPTNTHSINDAIDQLKQDLVPKIRQLCRRQDPIPRVAKPAVAQPAALGRAAPAVRRHPPLIAVPKGRIDVVAIGVSTGGPNALAELMPSLRADIGVPVVIVQHMPPTFTRLLAERLDRVSPLKVSEGVQGTALRAGEVLVAPGDYHMVVRRRGAQVVVEMNQAPPENSCRPSVDVLFRSVAEVYGANTLAVIMTGMGQDGLLGCQQLADIGATVLAQDEATSVVWGMPGFVARAGIADAVLPLGQLGAEIMKRATAKKPAVAGSMPAAVVGGQR